MSRDEVWLAAAPGLLLKRWAEPLAVAFAPSTATTHLLSEPAAELLLQLVKAPVTRRESATLLGAEDSGSDAPPHELAAIEAIVDGLIAAGLVRTVECPPR